MAIDKKHLSVLQESQQNKSFSFFSGNALDIVFQTRIIEVEKDYVSLENRVPPIYISTLVKSSQFMLQSQMVRFSSPVIDTDGQHILFPLKELNVIEETRGSARYPFSAEERVIAELMNPFDEQTLLTKKVLDMSATGISVRCPSPSKLFSPGVLFNSVHVKIDGESYTKSAARVVYLRKLMDDRGKLRAQVGLKFE